jgi:hypothetical protein
MKANGNESFIMNQSQPSHSIGIVISAWLEYELNKQVWCLIAQSVIPVIYFFSLFSNFDHVDFMSTAHFGIRIIMPVLYFVY